MDDPNVDIIMPWFVFQDDPLEENIVDILGSFQKQATETHSRRSDGRSFYSKNL